MQEVLASSSSPAIIGGVSQWVASNMTHDEFGIRLVQEVLASSPSPVVIGGVSQWVATVEMI